MVVVVVVVSLMVASFDTLCAISTLNVSLRNYASLIRCDQTCSLAKNLERRFRAGWNGLSVVLL